MKMVELNLDHKYFKFSENFFQQFLEQKKKQTKQNKKKITSEPMVSFRLASLLGLDKIIWTREKWIKEMSKTLMLFQETYLGKSVKSINTKRV